MTGNSLAQGLLETAILVIVFRVRVELAMVPGAESISAGARK